MIAMKQWRRGFITLLIVTGAALGAARLLAQPAPRGAASQLVPMGTTKGMQYSRLVIRNGMMVSGRGTPAEGPVDIVVERDRIVDIIPVDDVSLGSYGRSFKRAEGDRVIDATGMYVLPGLVDLHGHVPSNNERAGDRGLEYGYRLWLGHGVTTLREPGTGGGLKLMTEQRRLSEQNQIVAPRLVLYKRWPGVARGGDAGHTPDEARALVRRYKEEGADGIKVSKGPGHYPDVLAAICDEVKTLSMNGVAVDLKVSETDAVVASNAGVTSIEHWYGIPDAAIPGTQHFPPDYNYWNELDRFRYAGKLWAEADRYPGRLGEVLDLMIKNGTIWDPTMVVYETNRDFSRAVTLPWRARYTHPVLLEYWEPNPAHHASYHAEWKTSDDLNWKENFQIWMKWLHEFWKRGGKVTLGSDAGSLQALYGFSTIRELELLQEAGFHPIDVIKIATTNSQAALGIEGLAGLRIGNIADIIVVDGNPLDNFKVMYGLGYDRFTADGKKEHRGGVRWTIKAGVVFDAPALLKEVEWYVEQARGRTTSLNGR